MEKNNINAATKTCNRRQQSKCQLDGNCLSSCIIYKAAVSSQKEQVSYIGMASTKFKDRYNSHNKPFNHDKYENEVKLSQLNQEIKIENSISLGNVM